MLVPIETLKAFAWSWETHEQSTWSSCGITLGKTELGFIKVSTLRQPTRLEAIVGHLVLHRLFCIKKSNWPLCYEAM